MGWLTRALDELRQMHRVTGPAGVLMLLSLLAALGVSVAQATPQAHDRWAPMESTSVLGSEELTAWLPPAVTAGAPLRFVVELEAGRTPPTAAYLPGLMFDRVPLRFDDSTGLLRGEVRVPSDAPHRGTLTLRLTGRSGGEWDWTVALRAPAGPS